MYSTIHVFCLSYGEMLITPAPDEHSAGCVEYMLHCRLSTLKFTQNCLNLFAMSLHMPQLTNRPELRQLCDMHCELNIVYRKVAHHVK